MQSDEVDEKYRIPQYVIISNYIERVAEGSLLWQLYKFY